jgi:hypothetical protein
VSTWAQDSATGDMVLPKIGGLTLPPNAGPIVVTDPGQATRILLDNKLAMWLGEWFLDTRQGTPWLAILGVKNPDLNAFRQMISGILLATPPVAAANDVSLVFDRRTRHLAYSWTATLLSGVQIQGGTTPYVVELAS